MKTLPKLTGKKIAVNKSYKGLSQGEKSKIAGQVFTIKEVDWANMNNTKPCFRIDHERIHGYTFTWLSRDKFTIVGE